MSLWDDIRFAIRRLRHQPAFAAITTLTLALGLGANIAIFSLIHGLMYRALPVDRPTELFRLGDTTACCVNTGFQGSYALFSFRLYERLREATADDFETLAAFQANVTAMGVRREGVAGAESVGGQFVSGTYFTMFGVRPAIGRLLGPEDDRPGAPPVAVLSHETWTRIYGRDSALVGSALIVNGMPVTVIGVAARDFFGDAIRPNPAGLWLPIAQEPALRGAASVVDRPESNWLYAIGRVKAGARPEQIAARSTAALQGWLGSQSFVSETERATLPQQHINVVPAGGGIGLMQAQFAQSLTVLQVTSALVLLVAVANLANLLLARADRGQAAIRAALGASSTRLIRQPLVEGVMLAILGGGLGVVVAVGVIRALIALAFPGVAFMPIDATPSPAVLLFALALAIVTGALFTAAPAWAMSRTAPLEALAGVGRGGHQRSFVPRRSLVIVQVALSLILLSAATLLGRSLTNLESQSLGFETGNRLVLRLDPPAIAGQVDRLQHLYEGLRTRFATVPGVVASTYALYSPMEGNNWSSGISIGGRRVDPGQVSSCSWNRVGPGYFETLGTRAIRGRLLNERDTPGAARVVVVNDAFRRQFFPDGEVIGQHVGIGDASHASDYQIVGLVEDVKYTGAAQPTRPMLFLPAFQNVTYADNSDGNVQARSMLLRAMIVQTAPGAPNLEAALRRAAAEVDPDLILMRVLPLEQQVAANFRIQRLMARLSSVYGLLALGLASLGLYGITAYGVSQRRREIGLRIALGADRRQIIKTMLLGPVVQAAIGLAIGVPVAMFASRAIASQLYGVGAQDPSMYAVAGGVLIAIGAAAAFVPARRAAAIDPIKALRTE